MAYCLLSLVEVLEKILHPEQHHQNWVLDQDKLPQILSLLENACFLKDSFAKYAPAIEDRIECLEDRIREAAEMAEDILETHITRQVLSSHGSQSLTISPPDVHEVIEAFKTAKEDLIQIMDTVSESERLLITISSRRDPNPENMLVGITEDLIQLKNRLTGQSSALETIPITGMGGIGKTTLAQKLYYEYSSSRSRFDICAWATVSKDYNTRGVLLSLLGCIIEKPTNEMLEQTNNELIVTLYQSLFGRRYLIVFDDIWSSNVWDDVCTCFPNDNKGSRIILTTRENDVANYVNSKSHQMRLLNNVDSWELLRNKVYGEKSCPPELEEVGKIIASNCRGLPLAIQLMGGILLQVERRKNVWEQIASNVGSSIVNADEQFLGIFSWSYSHLPHYLKPCLLYVSGFPEDSKIPASKLIKLCVAEGFLTPVPDKSLEEVVEIYLQALVDRNLIFVHERKGNGKVKSYGMHDLLRELCQRKACEKKFIYILNLNSNHLQDDTLCLRRVSVHPSSHSHSCVDDIVPLKLMSFSRSFQLTCPATESILSSLCFELSLLRVLDLYSIDFLRFPEEILQLVNLRYLAFRLWPDLPEGISVLRNLQIILIRIRSVSLFRVGIFDLPGLRHVDFKSIAQNEQDLVDRNFPIQENLMSLSTLPLKVLTRLLGKIPNLRKLGIHCDTPPGVNMVDLTCFPKLEILQCSAYTSPGNFLSNLTFPDSIKKLTLLACQLPETVMNTIGLLPNLEILKLRCCTFESSTWKPSEDEFCQLQFLLLEKLNLVDWLADETHFPVLRELVIRDCLILAEIPLDIGGIETLEKIIVDECSPAVRESARKIHEEQLKYENFIHVRISASSL